MTALPEDTLKAYLLIYVRCSSVPDAFIFRLFSFYGRILVPEYMFNEYLITVFKQLFAEEYNLVFNLFIFFFKSQSGEMILRE